MDEIWHTHILFTQKYHKDMIKYFGFYLHHLPNEPDHDHNDDKHLNKKKETELVYLKEFGDDKPWKICGPESTKRRLSTGRSFVVGCGSNPSKCAASCKSSSECETVCQSECEPICQSTCTGSGDTAGGISDITGDESGES